MLRTLRCSCGATFDGATGEELLAAVEAHVLVAHAEAVTGRARGLSGREEQIAVLASTGATNDEVAATLGISRKTVEAHLTRVYRKLRVRSRTELAALGASGISPRPDGSLPK